MKAIHVPLLPSGCKLKFGDGKLYKFVRVNGAGHVEYSRDRVLTITSVENFLIKKPRATKQVMAEIRQRQ